VLFEDEVELLACLTRDVLAGVAGERWYWQHIPVDVAAGRTAGEVIADAWLSWPRWTPGAVATIGRAAAIAAVSTLSPRQSRRIRAAVTAEYVPSTGAAPSVEVNRRDRLQSPAEPSAGSAPAGGPWREWLTLPATLEPESAALLGLLTGLRQAERVARDPAFLWALQDWVDSQAGAFAPPVPPHPALAGAPTRRPAADTQTGHSDTVDGDTANLVDGDTADLVDGDTAATPRDTRKGDQALNTLIPKSAAAQTIVLPKGRAADLDGGGMREMRPAASAAREERDGADGTDSSHGSDGSQPAGDGAVRSQYASLFFLVNLLDRLQVADQASVSRFLDAPSGWALLELLGRELLTGIGEESSGVDEADSIWSVLAELDGREPGTVAAGVLGDLAGRALELLVRAAITVDALAQPGLIQLTRTHLDVVLDIETIDMAVRISGLDRDPNWVPELGRIIQFHFEAGVNLV
jgi:hypothetical protein